MTRGAIAQAKRPAMTLAIGNRRARAVIFPMDGGDVD